MKFKQSPPNFKNVFGPLIQSVQAKLNAAGFDAGAIDGVWGARTMTAITAWQKAKDMQSTGEVDDATWNGLLDAPIPALSQRALQLTGAWEGTGYSGTNGNFDGQGITWGVVGFTWGNGELQGILREIRARYPDIFSQAFGNLEPQIVNVLGQPLSSQMAWARTISSNGGNSIADQWSAAFNALGSTPEVQQIENQHAQHYWDAGAQFASDFGLTGEAGQALCFDIAVQDTITHAMISEIVAKTGQCANEADKIQIIAHIVADHANPKYYNDVLLRKMTFATGQGPVHGDLYDITCWGIG